MAASSGISCIKYNIRTIIRLMTKRISAIALCRVSTAEQRLSNSLTRQELSVQNAADELNVGIEKVWSGDVSSKAGNNIRRKDLMEMLTYVRQHKSVKYLIIDEVDRFMRSLDEMFYWKVVLKDLGVSLWFASNPELNDDSAQAKLLLSLDGYKAEGSNEERQRKSIQGHKAAIREGRYTFPPLPGYMKGNKPGIHVLNPLYSDIWQSALKDVASRLYTPSSALKRLNSYIVPLGKPALKIDKFNHFIANPFYCGTIVVGGQVNERCEKGLHPTLITRAEHESILEVLALRPNRQIRKLQYNPEFPLNKIIEHDCDDHSPFTGSFQGNGQGKRYPKYRCRRCGKQYHRSEVHGELNNVLSSIHYDGNQRKEFISALTTVWKEKQQYNIRHIKTLQKRLNSLKTTKSSLIREHALSVGIQKEEIAEEITNLRDEISLISDELTTYKDIYHDLVEFIKFSLEYTNRLKDDWWDLGQEDRLKCQQLLFPDGIRFQSNKKVGTGQISPLYRLASNKKDLRESRKSLMVELEGIAPSSSVCHAYSLQA